MPIQAAIHIAKSLEKFTARPKLVKEYTCPNVDKKKARAYNKFINNWAISG
jgi:hypothetical protein